MIPENWHIRLMCQWSANYFVQVWLILSLKRWQKMSMSDCVKKQHSNQRKERNPKWALIKIYSLSTNVRDAQIHFSWQNLGFIILDHDKIFWLSFTSSACPRRTSWIIGTWSRSKNGCLGGGKGSLQVLAIHGDDHLEVLLTEPLLQVCQTLEAL